MTTPIDRDDGATRIAETLAAWHDRAARDLPWRDAPPGRRDPYRVLVSELMLQQTQVSRVVDRFETFLRRFPTVDALAAAPEADVLAAWSGLGYYRRARMLHAAAREIVQTHAGAMPSDPVAVRALPGVGRYTAGAICSMSFDAPEPIVDGNVARVLLRLAGRDEPPAGRDTQRWLWDRAAAVARATERPGAVNEALMELGATVCTPRNPRCLGCPVAEACEALRSGRQDEIPPPKPSARKSPLFADAVLCVDRRGRRLVERRPDGVLWAGLWQAPTLERDDRFATPDEIRETLGIDPGDEPAGSFRHQTTHRDVRFRVWRGVNARAAGDRAWRSAAQIESLALGTPQRRVLLETPA